MVDWQPLLQSIFLGLVLSFLLVKIISRSVSFKEDNLSLTRNCNDNDQLRPKFEAQDDAGSEDFCAAHEADSVSAEQGSVRNESFPVSDQSSEDDWEGLEIKELDEMFSAATAFVAASASDGLSAQKVSYDVQLQLYGLYMIATEGPCSTPQPSAFRMTARAKWQAWKKLGAMPPEEAMQNYIDILTYLHPSWMAGSTLKSKGGYGVASRGLMGPAFSTFVYEEDSRNNFKMDAIHAFARDGEMENLLMCIESGAIVNSKDSEGRTPLHWAVDRGHFNVTELLLSKNANVNAKDNEGQTPLHYAAICDHKDIAEYLVKRNAETNVMDNDGNTPCDLCESNWTWMQRSKGFL